jgi:hypothetical protein
MQEFKNRLSYTGYILAQPRYWVIALATAFIYIVANIIVVLHVHGTIGAFYTSMFSNYTVSFTALVAISGILLGINSALLVAKINELQLKSAGLSFTGIFFGSLAAGCPGCFFGLFPIFMSLFGITGTLALLPFNGLELQLGAIILVLVSTWFLAEESEMVCELDYDDDEEDDE